MTYYAPVVAALATMLITLFLLSTKTGQSVQDIPNERSLHTAPIPRVGGLGIMGGIFSAWALLFNSLDWWIVLPVMLLAALSAVDDVRGLPVRLRLLGQFGAALLAVLGSGLASQYPVYIPLLLIGMVWMTNLYNFMDGSDGLAGGMAFFGFTAYGGAALMGGNEGLAMLNFSVGAAALGFLYFNFHPARVFMGDAGSIPLGFLAAIMGLSGWQQSLWSLWFPLLVFSPFIVDATATLLRRVRRGARVTEAHREHYYQRLVQMGYGHRNVALMEYGVMATASVLAIFRLPGMPEWLTLLFAFTLYLTLMKMVDARWSAFQHVEKS